MMLPQKALEKLIAGNERFAGNKSAHSNRCKETREILLKRQKPFAAVLACSDSRVPVEIVFDAGLGDIFTVRTAGHVLSKEILGSLEYAVKVLGVKLIVILGHENCGAIKTAIETPKDNKEISENFKAIMEHIYPAIENAGCDKSHKNFLHRAVIANINYQLGDLLKKDEYLAKKTAEGEIMLKGALYNLATGKVIFIA